MEHALVAPRAGTVMEVAVEAGQQVPEGAQARGDRRGRLGEADQASGIERRLAVVLALCWAYTCYIAAGHVKLHRLTGISDRRRPA